MKTLDLTKILKVGDIVYSTVLGDCVVKDINPISTYSILVSNGDLNRNYTRSGHYTPGIGECTLFPSKENRDWNNYKKYNIKLTIESCHHGDFSSYAEAEAALEALKEILMNGDYIISEER